MACHCAGRRISDWSRFGWVNHSEIMPETRSSTRVRKRVPARSISYSLPLALVLAGVFGASLAWAADIESLANERIPVNRLRMEAQWGVDCEAALLQVAAMARDDAEFSDGPLDSAQLGEDLRRCGLIYNTPDTDLFTPCPDYRAWRHWLVGETEAPSHCR